MKIGILGAGPVAQTIGTALVQNGHTVFLGSRSSPNEKVAAWLHQCGGRGKSGSFQEAATFGELLFVCLNGGVAVDVINQTGAESFREKVVIDVTNPLDFSRGMPPTLLPPYNNQYSLGEHIQATLPDAFVVKALNTVTARLMVNALLVNDGNHNLFICGNNAEAKNTVKHLLAENFYWKPENIMDMGSIESARLTEAIIPFWVGVMQVMGTSLFNYQIVR
jgi:predicted dinucleotide-binding enzyme